jgi:N-acetylneuraminic acid mutarotase
MKQAFSLLVLLAIAGVLSAAATPEFTFDPIPVPLTNNAVASFNGAGGLQLVSFMGIGPAKTWKSVTNATYALVAGSGKWNMLRPVPGTVGRLGVTAVEAKGQVLLLGGYVLDAQGDETTVSDVNIYEPKTDHWYRAIDIPSPVSAAIGGAYRDRYVYLIGGWSKNGATQAVQIYDLEKANWLSGSPYPGSAVFGHAGTIVGDTIVYVDGALKNPAGQPAYVGSDECWMGKIDHKDPTKIQWTKLPPHPGTAHFRIAAGGSEKDGKIYFAGGSASPYDTAGLGFDGKLAEPSTTVFDFDLRTNKWEEIPEKISAPTMDQRGLIVTPHYLILMGGMGKGGTVTGEVTLLPKHGEPH